MSSLENKLISACKAGDLEKTKNLIEQIGLFEDLMYIGNSEDEVRDMAKFLIGITNDKFGYPCKNRIFIDACRDGDLKYARILFGLGAKIKSADNLAVREASKFGRLEIVKFLVTGDPGDLEPGPGNKADITADNNYAVREASWSGHLETVKFLVEHKADITAENNQAVRWASAEGHLEIVKFLVEHKADITAENNQAVIDASANGHLETVKFLVTGDPGDLEPGPGNKADITAENNGAVHFASRNGHLETVKFLLSKGADFFKLSSEHQTYFRTLKIFRRWRKKIFLRKLIHIALPIYYSPGFSGSLKGKKLLENFVDGLETAKE